MAGRKRAGYKYCKDRFSVLAWNIENPGVMFFIFTQVFHDQKIGVFDEHSHQIRRHASIENDGIPVIFIHMVARRNFLKL